MNDHFALCVTIPVLSVVQVSFLLPISQLLSPLYLGFLEGVQGWTLLLLRVGVGILFLRHGYPKMIHLRQWTAALQMPITLCFLSALSMLGGGLCLILGLLTPLASIAILGSMAFALVLEIRNGSPFVAPDPYLIPPDQYVGSTGQGEPPSYEKAFVYCLMLIAIAGLGPGAFSLDALIFRP